jgi:transcriptional regulator with PAS, ATPase and Fis domain
MPRLDVRSKTEITALAVRPDGARSQEVRVKVKELSLSSGVLAGLDSVPLVPFLVKIALPDRSRVELAAEALRGTDGRQVVRFFFPQRQALASLWAFIRTQPQESGLCPYCAQPVSSTSNCPHCGRNLELSAATYLDQHLQATLTERLAPRLEHLDTSFIQRIMAMMDRAIIGEVEARADEEFVGTTPAMLDVFAMIRRAAATDMNILILGESGTGKELTAMAIHEKSLRREGPLIVVNCAAIPEGLLEGELFGHEKGAFTGAHAAKKGRFELANGGTIFLDEIGDLSAPLQAKLLRFLEDRIVERVGGKSGIRVDVRIIAATNCDLEGMVAAAGFRGDLFYRLNSFTIKLPPLRDRGEDKVILAKYLFQKIGRIEQSPLAGLSDAALEAIRRHDWPGNVRELVNKIRRAIVMAPGELIEPADLELAPVLSAGGLAAAVRGSERDLVCAALESTGYVVARAARALGVSRPTLYSLLRRHQIGLPKQVS